LIPVLVFIAPLAGLSLWGIKWILQSILIRGIYQLIHEPKPGVLNLLAYECFISANTIMTAIFALLPLKTNWKNRHY
jgi:hypothetical protein